MTPKKICKTCGDWEPKDSEYRKLKQILLGYCKKAEDVSRYGFDDGTNSFGLYSSDCEGYSSTIMTGEHFGCIHWRKRV
jgi:hypothetical protein